MSGGKQKRRIGLSCRPLAGDIIACAVVAAIAAAMLCFMLIKPDGAYAKVTTPDGVYTLPLSDDGARDFSGGGYTLSVEISDGAVRVSHSDCPDGICVARGFISRSGSAVICVPAGIVVQVINGGGDGEDYDVAVG